MMILANLPPIALGTSLVLACLAAQLAHGSDGADDTTVTATTVLPATPARAQSRPGYGFELTYRWNARPMAGDYGVFVHVENEDGDIVLRDNHAPPQPTSEWSGVVEYTRLIHLPAWTPDGRRTRPGLPEGAYTIHVGLHEGGDWQPLAAADGVTASEPRRYQIAELIIDKDAPLPDPGPETLDLTGYRLTFEETFDTLPDISAWGPIEPGGAQWIAHTPYRGDFGDARFADPTDTFPFTVEDSTLRIEARQNDAGQWEAGLLSSVDTEGNGFAQQYGYFEMRAKFPEGPGTWPAFWLLALPRVTEAEDTSIINVEIDVVEQYGHWPNKLTTAIHRWDRGTGRHQHLGDNLLVHGMTEDFHTYGVKVTQQQITFYFDGVEIRREPTPDEAHVPMFMMVNFALGPGWPLDKTPNPSYMYVDYVRAYAKDEPDATQ
ncbi:MAG: glycoside hydrolase family 16 protein [Phycisphaeraceae bacterium]